MGSVLALQIVHAGIRFLIPLEGVSDESLPCDVLAEVSGLPTLLPGLLPAKWSRRGLGKNGAQFRQKAIRRRAGSDSRPD